MKLTDVLKAQAHKSSILIPCDVTPGHSDNRYVHITFQKTTMTRIKENGEEISVPVEAKIDLNVCPLCYNQFV